MDLGLKGKVVVITGSTEGIGRAAALKFAREGASVAICSRSQEKVDATVAEIKKAGGEVFGMAADIGKADDIEAASTELPTPHCSMDSAQPASTRHPRTKWCSLYS